MRHRRSRAAARERGFVLVLVLVTLALLSAGALALTVHARGSIGLAGQVIEDARIRSVLDAATARVLDAFLPGGDYDSLFNATSRTWSFAGEQVTIAVERESAKPDVNHAKISLIEAFLDGTETGLRVRADIRSRLDIARRTNSPLPSLAALLSPCDRLTSALRELEGHFTIMTRASGVATGSLDDADLLRIPGANATHVDLIRRSLSDGRSPIDDPRLAIIRDHLSDESGIVTVVIRFEGQGGWRRERRLSLLRTIRAPFLEVIAVADKGRPAATVCN